MVRLWHGARAFESVLMPCTDDDRLRCLMSVECGTLVTPLLCGRKDGPRPRSFAHCQPPLMPWAQEAGAAMNRQLVLCVMAFPSTIPD